MQIVMQRNDSRKKRLQGSLALRSIALSNQLFYCRDAVGAYAPRGRMDAERPCGRTGP